MGGDRGFAAFNSKLKAAYPSAFVWGCTTCGEISQDGLLSHSTTVFAHANWEPIAGVLLPKLASIRFSEGEKLVEDLLHQGGWSFAAIQERPQDFLFLVLSDGLSGMEEVLLTALTNALPGVPLVGGSAADDFKFLKSHVAMQGKAIEGGAAVVLLEPKNPFHVFQMHGFVSTQRTIVPTSSDPERRLIHRIDGWPAVEVIAEFLGMETSELLENPQKIFSKNPIVFGHGEGDVFFLRAVMGFQGTSALMGGAVEEGLVLHVMQGRNPPEKVRKALLQEFSLCPDPEGVLLFQCGGRLLEAREMGEEEELAEAFSFRDLPCAGFLTYGEHLGPFQLNHTITGVVFGSSK